MTIINRIEDAFRGHVIPSKLIESNFSEAEQIETLYFFNRDWREITWDDWEKHRDAIYFFTPEAFVYFLPSILSLSIQHPEKWFWPADCLIGILDRSPNILYWDEFILSRLTGLHSSEYEAIKYWLVHLSEHNTSWTQATLGRAFDTINLLQNTTGVARTK